MIYLLLGIVLNSCTNDENLKGLIEFKKTFYHLDSTYYKCFKTIPEFGSIILEGNAILNRVNGMYGIALINYSDTLGWRSNEVWFGTNEIIGLEFQNLEVRKYTVANGVNAASTLGLARGSYGKWDNDSPLANYRIDLSQFSYFKVTSIDSINKIAEGRFELHFILTDRYSEDAKYFANEIDLVDGIFKARITF